MLEGLKEALQYVVNLGNDAEKVQVLEICGETYANKRLERYGAPKRAGAIGAASLSAMVDYIAACSEEFDGKKMVIRSMVRRRYAWYRSLILRERENACSYVRQRRPSTALAPGTTRKSL